jgi:predicted ATPase/DNA-binding winged helix-turn-helix (wHTH) protein
MQSDAGETLEFARFRVLPRQRQLLADGVPVELGSRAFDVLLVLLEARGSLVTKNQLLDRVWSGTVVEENNIQVQISALRKAFGDDRNLILTVPLRGYRFTGAVRTVADADGSVQPVPGFAPSEAPAPVLTNIPASVSDFIGRDQELQELAELIKRHRLVTVVGTGGIGKTRLAVEQALSLLPEFSDGVWLAPLAPLSDPQFVPAVTTAALGLQGGAAQWPAERRAAALRGKRLLLVLDNCEHVAAAAAAEAELLLHVAPTLHLLATSQEPLGIDGECVFRLQPLALPEDGSAKWDATLRNAAVRFFVARVRSADPHFVLDESVAPTVATICRRLDGIPLALELAAARAATLGIEELARRLDDRFRLLTGGRRTALPRYQTLRATLDWSYKLLSDPAQTMLRRLAAFSGRFDLDAAARVVADEALPDWTVVDHVAELVNRSLVMADDAGPHRRYRLLETTRVYALEKLADSGEFAIVARRHAVSLCDRFPQAVAEWETLPTLQWLDIYAPEIHNLRVALDWAFGPDGDADLGLRLAAISFILWPLTALKQEGRSRLEHAIANLSPMTPKPIEALLWFGYGFLTAGTPRGRALPALRRSIALYREIDDPVWLARALSLYGLNLARSGDVAEGRTAIEEALALLAKASPGSKSYARCLTNLAITRMVASDYDGARAVLEEALSLSSALGAHYWVLRTLLYKAEIEFADGHIVRAIAGARELLALCRPMRRSGVLGNVLCNLGGYLAVDGAMDEARAMLQEGLPLALEGEIGSAELAGGLQSLAVIALAEQRTERAAQLMGYANAFFSSEFQGRNPAKLKVRDRLMETLQGSLAPDRLAALIEAGARWTEDEAMATALRM